MPNPALRARYLADAVTTASPGQLLVMLYDRLATDLTHAERFLQAGDREAGSARLLHAQDIITELRATLDVNAWDGGPGLAALYGFLFTDLVQANVRQDADRVTACRRIVEPLRDAWRMALAETMRAAVGVGVR
jgi:flagellar protein FliS